MSSTPTIFISYSRRDGHEFAQSLREQLKDEFALWQDVVALQGGDDWWEAIKGAIERVDTLLLVITKKALLSHFVRRE
ncbi:MAG: toll/interleukin-1 receptor domain-containing protein [Chloroflexota bacterium]|nr:toll/interleukin-1 receptor domain-containing protein [Chloroflexota bacterium]